MNAILEVSALTKKYGSFTAVDRLDFAVNRGEIYGFLGQNGAGKSTSIRMILGLVRPDAGRIRIFDKEMPAQSRKILARLGALVEKPDLYPYLNAREHLEIMSRLNGLKRTCNSFEADLERVGLSHAAGKKTKQYSQGMKQRLGIALALVHDPELIILDEPTNGLDPQGIADMRNLILHLSRNEGKTLIISSHLLNEIELVADSMLIIDRGRKVREGKVSALLNPSDTLVELKTSDDVAASKLIAQSSYQLIPAENSLRLKMHRDEVPQFAKWLVSEGVEIYSLNPRHSLEDYFLSLTSLNQHVAAYQD